MDNLFLVSWDQLGLEALINITGKEKAAMFEVLATPDGKAPAFHQWLSELPTD